MTWLGGGLGAASAGAAAAMLLGAAAPAPAPPLASPQGPSDIPFELLSPDLYRSVTLKWTGGSAPLCAVIRGRRDWEALTRTIAGPKAKAAGAPTSDEWNRHAVLLVARQIGIGKTPVVFQVDGVHRDGSTIELDYTLIPSPPAGGTTWYAALAIPKPLTPTVTFKEAGRVVCTVQPMAGHWVSPSRPAPPPPPPAESDLSPGSQPAPFQPAPAQPAPAQPAPLY